MATGANFEIIDGRIQWWKPLIYGDALLAQDHEARAHSMQVTYRLYPEYGNPFVDTLTAEISETERNMRIQADMKQCTLQDGRFIDCIVDQASIVVEKGILTFNYSLIKADGGSITETFTS